MFLGMFRTACEMAEEASAEPAAEPATDSGGAADAAAAPAAPGPGQPGEDFGDSDGVDAEFEAAVGRRNELGRRVAEARAELASHAMHSFSVP